MNTKQFRRRWLNGKIESELFYAPIKKPIKKVKQSMIIKINVINAGISERYLTKVDISRKFPCQTFYNLRDANGDIVNRRTRPDLFWDRPYNGADENAVFWLSDNMTEEIPNLYFTIDWGDGNIESFPKQIIKTTLNEEVFTFESIFRYDVSNTTFNHTYEKSGEYIITVSGYIDNLAIGKGFYYNNQKSENWKLIDVLSWGDLNFKALAGTLSSVISDMDHVPKLEFKYWKKVITIYCFASHWGQGNLWNDEKEGLKIDWDDIGGDRFFDNFPNLVDLYDCFYESTITYIPAYCFKNNPWIQRLDYCFYQCELKYIGEYACANLKYLTSAAQIVYLSRDLGNKKTIDERAEYIKNNQLLQYIGDCAFENCINMTDSISLNSLFMMNTGALDGKGWERIGNRVFKNCKKLISHHGNNVGWAYLEYIGDELFAGCENLRSLTYMFMDAYNLKYIGKDIFKGCKNLRNTECTFCYCCFKLNLPDKLFYDVEYNGGDYSFDFKIDNQHSFEVGTQWGDNQKKRDVLDFLASNSAYFPKEHQKMFKILKPELYEKMKLKYIESYPKYSGYHFGKNMFNEKFLKALGENGGKIAAREDTMFDGHCDIYIYGENFKLVDWELYNRNTGEAPPVWKYSIKMKFGEIGVGEYDGVNIHGDLKYDNSDEIPKEPPWVKIYPIYPNT